MKNLNFIFNLLLFPFLFLKVFSLFQNQNKYIIKPHPLKLFFIIPLLFSLMSTQVMGEDNETANDTCPPGEILTISSGANTFTGTIGTVGDLQDYYQIPIPADGNISITWESAQLTGNKTASLTVGDACNSFSNYDGTTPAYTHTTNRIPVIRNVPIFIRIFNGTGKGYTLNIDYDIDIDESTIESPEFCYEYAYGQTDNNLIKGDDGNISIDLSNALSDPLLVKLLVRLVDINNTFGRTNNIITDILDIDITQVTYQSESVVIKKPGRFVEESVADALLDLSNPSSIKNIELGSMLQAEYFTIDYALEHENNDIDFPLNIQITYDISVPVQDTYATVTQDQNISSGSIEMCDIPGEGYTPAYSIFNIEHNDLNNDEDYTYYNLPTQISSRVDDFQITAYEFNDPHERQSVSTLISVEMINLDDIAGYPDACSNPESAISPRIWLPFLDLTAAVGDDSNISQVPFNRDTLDAALLAGATSDHTKPGVVGALASPEDFYAIANKNTAFRVTFKTLGDGDSLLEVENTAQGLRFTNFPELVQDITYCRQTVVKPNAEQGTTDLVAVACSNAGNNSTYRDLAICLECLHGYDTRYLCSRDNFAIRPESFRVSLSDQDQTTPTTKSFIKSNIDTNQLNIVAGYNYAIEVNATNYLDDKNTEGYTTQFSENNASENEHFSLIWQHFTDDYTYCNDTSDHNKTMTFENGRLVDDNITNAQIGHYFLEIVDAEWTEHDYSEDLLTHRLADPTHFLDVEDCRLDLSITTSENTVLSPDTYSTSINGCAIKSEHTRINGTVYTNIDTMIYPYTFDHSDVIPFSGPNSDRNQTFIYINTPDMNDLNMSYNMNGTFRAVGYDDGNLSNFVDQCYSDDVNMTLHLQYLHPQPTDSEPFLSYDLIDTDSTNSIIEPRPSVTDGEPTYRFDPETLGPLSITQEDEYFVKDMEGAITMDLGYNFKRTYHEALNPRKIQMNDFNITYITNPANIKADLESNFEIFGNKDLNDTNISFVYGRARPSKLFYEDILEASAITPITVVAYCDPNTLVAETCSFYGIATALGEIDEKSWYLSLEHNASLEDGDITIIIGSPLIEPVGASPDDQAVVVDGTSYTYTATPTSGDAGNVMITTSGVNNNVSVSRGANPTLPLTVPIELVREGDSAAPPYTNEWLIYNKDTDDTLKAPPSPFYKVRFIGDSNWTGVGETGDIVQLPASRKKSKKMDW